MDYVGKSLPLTEFTKFVPPGWAPNLQDYSFKSYLDRLQLWWRCCDDSITESKSGPLVAARLVGKPFRIAIKLRVVRDGQLFVGDAALVLEPRPEGTTDPTTGAPLPADISGLGHLLRELTKLFMIHDDDYNDLTLDSFF